MSDSVVNTGAQDVLSSVKRLVNEDTQEESEFIFIPTASAPKPGRLVLTDALRISDEPLIPEKLAPLKLTPKDSAPTKASGASKPSSEPMRLQPSDIVQGGQPKEDVMADEVAPKRDLAGSLSAKIEALEAAIARTEDQWEPDGESDDDYSGTKTEAVNWPVENEGAQSKAADPESEPVATFIRDPAIAEGQSGKNVALNLSEEELRELVAQIVREELQGALGERITRNLRKMVRREITRAVVGQSAE